MRILGLDFGAKTVGVAVSDPLGITAQGVEIIRRQKESKLRQTLARIAELTDEYQADAIVLGFPKNMSGTIGNSNNMIGGGISFALDKVVRPVGSAAAAEIKALKAENAEIKAELAELKAAIKAMKEAK